MQRAHQLQNQGKDVITNPVEMGGNEKEMLEKVLAYNIAQIIRVRKKLSETEQMERAAA